MVPSGIGAIGLWCRCVREEGGLGLRHLADPPNVGGYDFVNEIHVDESVFPLLVGDEEEFNHLFGRH